MPIDRTRTDIANMAADFLDADPIGNIADEFGYAPIYARNYDEALETVIAEFEWNGTKARAQLDAISIPLALNSTDFQNAFVCPSDMIVALDINGRPVEELHWEVEMIANVDQFGNVTSRTKVLYCDFAGPIILRYQTACEPAYMSPHLAKAVALELGIRCCNKVTNSTSKLQQLGELYAETTKGNVRRTGGHSIDTKQNRPAPRRTALSPGERARRGDGL